jgi:O-Antigen ligase
MNTMFDTILRRTLTLGIASILLLIPFHALLTVWLSSIFGHYTVLRLWKELVLVGLVVAAIVVVVRTPGPMKKVFRQPLFRLLIVVIVAYALLTVVSGLVAVSSGRVTWTALGYGLVSNLRFLAFFMVCIVAASYFHGFFKGRFGKLAHWPAIVVVIFGLLQFLVLPADILRHVGYGPDTISPFIAVDGKLNYIRAQSTLRGPNPLGAYMVVVATALAAMIIHQRKKYQLLLMVGVLTVMYATYSRSAWIGLLLSLLVLAVVYIPKRLRVPVAAGCVVLAIVASGLIFALRDNNTAQNVLFHTDETSKASTSSNYDRANALNGGFRDIVREPFGRGVGTAGPASVYNDSRVRISENYFLQIGQEVGAVGLLLFMMICGLVGAVLWQLRAKNPIAIVLLASLVGLTFINFLSHAWADDTLAYVWWGFAGLCIGAALFDSKKIT